MRLIASTRTLEIPSDVSIEVKARKVRVKGPRGTFFKEAMEERKGFVSAGQKAAAASGGGDRAAAAALRRSNCETSRSLGSLLFSSLSPALYELRHETISVDRRDGDLLAPWSGCRLVPPDQNDKERARETSKKQQQRAAAHHRKRAKKISPLFQQNTPKTGTLTRDFKHLAVDMFLVEEEGKKVRRVWLRWPRKRATTAAIGRRALQSTTKRKDKESPVRAPRCVDISSNPGEASTMPLWTK